MWGAPQPLSWRERRRGVRVGWRALVGRGATGMGEGGGGSSRQRNSLGAVCQPCGFWLLASFQEEAESGRLGWGLPSRLWAPR